MNLTSVTVNSKFTLVSKQKSVCVVTAFDTPAPGVNINFDLDEASGVRLQARSATSNEFGIAKVTVWRQQIRICSIEHVWPNIQGFLTTLTCRGAAIHRCTQWERHATQWAPVS